MTTNWNDVERAAPALAEEVRARFEATGLGMLATLRKDGSPRISGVEPSFFRGELWLGMMDASRKGQDLRRDPRLSLHSATIDKEVKDGDVKVSGRAVEVSDEEQKRRFLREFNEVNGYGPPEDSAFQLFTVDITEVARISPGGDHLVIESWAPGQAVKRIERR